MKASSFLCLINPKPYVVKEKYYWLNYLSQLLEIVKVLNDLCGLILIAHMYP